MFTSSVAGLPPPAAPSTLAPAPASPVSRSVGASTPLASIQSSVNNSQVAALTISYSTSVAGKSYSGSVEESGGTYTASVPGQPGASANGSSVQSAENNLDAVLDSLA